LYVDDELVINAWYPMRGSRTRDYSLEAGDHTIRVEYFERTQVAQASVTWELLGAAPAAAPPGVPVVPVSPVCMGGPLRLEAWPTTTRCVGGGWAATIYVNGIGGDCLYTYAWEREVRAGPTYGSATFELWSPVIGAMVGEASATSAGQTVKVGLYIRAPEACK
jgi:hypothetical protein